MDEVIKGESETTTINLDLSLFRPARMGKGTSTHDRFANSIPMR